MGGRSTAIKLKDGGVWVLASTTLDAETKAKINELGNVKYGLIRFFCLAYCDPPSRYIINPDAVHHLFLPEFKRAYPDAKVIGVADTIRGMTDQTFPFDGRTFHLSMSRCSI
jgi:hypothetical protein